MAHFSMQELESEILSRKMGVALGACATPPVMSQILAYLYI